MRVLLWHEMSGFHVELARGLRANGVDVCVATLPGGQRQFSTDYFMGYEGVGRVKGISRALIQFWNFKAFRTFDVVQFISPTPYVSRTEAFASRLFPSSAQRTVFVAAGSDAIYRRHVQELEYYPPHDLFDMPQQYDALKRLLNNVDHIVPVCWEYDYSMRRAGYIVREPIPFPINIESSQPHIKPTNAKIIVYHPLNRSREYLLRYDFKGTQIIEAAFDLLRKKYSKYVDFIVRGDMSHEEYKNFSANVDILVDQVYSYSYGMSAAYAMARGQIVVSGLHPSVVSGDPRWEFWSHCPVQHAPQTSAPLAMQLEALLDDEVRRRELSQQSRHYAEVFHDAARVAQRYLSLYENTRP